MGATAGIRKYLNDCRTLVSKLPAKSISCAPSIILIRFAPKATSVSENFPSEISQKVCGAKMKTILPTSRKNKNEAFIIEDAVSKAFSLSFFKKSVKIGIKTVDMAPTTSTE